MYPLKNSILGSLMLLFLMTAGSCRAEDTASGNIRPVTVADGLDHPWSIAFLPDGEFLVTERSGKLLHIKPDGKKTDISGMPEVHSRGQAGLFDVATAPDFISSGIIYLSYAGSGPGGNNTELVRAKVSLDEMLLMEKQVIFRASPKVSGNNHYGGRILFAPDGALFLTLGDRFEYRNEAQNTSNHLGAIVRLNPDGSIPADNPLKDKSDARPEIYSYGHRNVQGIALQPGTGLIWSHEHGPRGGDEVNILKAGANYGWPAVTFGEEYSGGKISDKTSAPGMEDPVLHWTPSIAPSGMTFYSGSHFPEWQGDIFLGALAGQHLRRLKVQGTKIIGEEILMEGIRERIRDVRSGPDGFLYILTDSSAGRLIRLEPAQ
jgi:aldose sugar dehydrogenase